ncbi:homeobox-leucine zipper protein family [Striga asiatica]|uniref:Homeobox-leucine zipper protein family n=1 Tax=Striga asiatica TaxID=4170 RepID=A0A5A7QV05_STRAF|nr:homeobox-leucine zipper protein family [Striga asiatica]
MELGLSLGDASPAVGSLKVIKSTGQDKKPAKMVGLDFCMGLGLGLSSAATEDQKPNGKAREINGDDDNDEDNDEASQGGEESDGNNQRENPVVQLNLLPLVPVNPCRQISSHLIQSLPWSSDNGSSENESSGNIGICKGPEEVSSANSVDLQLLKRSPEVERASDDEEESGPHARKKLRLSKQQSAFLEETFKEHNNLNPKQKLALAKQLNLRTRQVEVWFQNRRARTKLKQTEVECEYLKRCCETLTEENRRLQKEVQQVRALKTSNQFHAQLPATTLTMCPSCQRVTKPTDKNSIQFRPKFYPFSSNHTHHPNNNQPATS